MAITAVGFDGTVTEAQFARFMRSHGEVGYKHGVTTGLVTTAAGGTRAASVSAGSAVLPGLLADSNAAVSTTHAANATAANRVDYVVLEADWSTNAVAVVVVQGSSSTPPALTQAEGSLWQMPLARVTVRPSVTTLLSTDVVVCKPLPRVMLSADDTLTPVTRAWNSGGYTVAEVTFADPGWPYRLHVDAACRFNGGSTGSWNGYGILYAYANGASIGEGHSEGLANVGTHGAHLAVTTGVRTGPVTVQARIAPSSMTSASSLVLLSSGSNHFGVDQIPA